MKPNTRTCLTAALVTAAITAVLEISALALFSDTTAIDEEETKTKRPQGIQVVPTDNLELKKRIQNLEQELIKASNSTNVWKSSYEDIATSIDEFRQLVQENTDKSSKLYNRIRTIGLLFFNGVDEKLRTTARSLEALDEIDTSSWSAEDAALHQQYRQLVARKYACQNRYWLTRMNSILTASDRDPIYRTNEEDQRREQFRAEREISQLRNQERDLLLRKTAEALSLPDADAQSFVATMNEINEILGKPPLQD